MKHVYVVVNKSMMMLGVFTTWEKNKLINLMKKEDETGRN